MAIISFIKQVINIGLPDGDSIAEKYESLIKNRQSWKNVDEKGFHAGFIFSGYDVSRYQKD